MPLDRASIRSVLALRFRDATTDRPITDGLEVSVYRERGGGSSTRAVQTVSGAYAAQGLTGLRVYEREPRDIPDTIPDDVEVPDLDDRVSYGVEIYDRKARFVPVQLRVDLPYTPKERYSWLYPVVDPPAEEQDGELGPPEPTVYLFSAVSRPVSTGQVVVYADLMEEQSEEGGWSPAAHALMEVRLLPSSSGETNGAEGNHNGELAWYGLADAQGRVAVQFPMPTLQLIELSDNDNGEGQGGGQNGNASPQGSEGERLSVLSGRGVPIEVRVYRNSALPVPERASRPPMTSIMNQSTRDPRPIYEKPDSHSPTLGATLCYGKPLVLRTEGHSVLRIASESDD